VGAVVIALAAGAMSVGGTGTGTGAGVGAGSGSGISQSLRTRVSAGKSNARGGRPDAAWRDLGLRRLRRTVRQGAPCAMNSYGEVQQFLVRTPCRSLDRVLLVLDDGAGNSMVVSVSWVRMRGTRAAADLARLADEPGTGNVAPLPGALVRAGDIRWTGTNYASRRERSVVVIAEVEPVGGAPGHELMDGVAEVAAELAGP